MTTHILELKAGELRLALRADLGAAIAGLWHGALPILRSTEPAALQTSRKAACYPLVPYSNRIAWRKFSWQGRDYTTQRNFDDNPHSVHGVGWRRPWSVVEQGATAATLKLVHQPDADWPFPFEATQRFELSAGSLAVRLAIVNTAAIDQPVGLGWHPYFEKRSQSRLDIEVSERWDPDAHEIPVKRVAQPGIAAPVAELDFDNCFDGFRGAARIRDEAFSMQLTSTCGHLVIYTPKDKPYYCVEPVSHVSDAIHMADPMAHGLVNLAPGASFEASWRLDVEAL